MKKNLTFLALLCLLIFTACSDDYVPYRFETNPLPGTALMMYDDFIPYDYNHDGKDEIIVIGHYIELDGISYRITMITQEGGYVKGSLINEFDADPLDLRFLDIVKNPVSGKDEVWVNKRLGDYKYLSVYTLPEFKLRTETRYPLEGNRQGLTALTVSGFLDIELLVVFQIDSVPFRGIRAYDKHTLDLMWECLIPGQVLLFNENKPLIHGEDTLLVFSTHACNHGSKWGNWRDDKSGLVILNTKGELIDTCIIGPNDTWVSAVNFDIDNNGSDELLIATSKYMDGPPVPGGMWIWYPDRENQLIKTSDIRGGYRHLTPIDTDRDGIKEILTNKNFNTLLRISFQPKYTVEKERALSESFVLVNVVDFLRKNKSPWIQCVFQDSYKIRFYDLDNFKLQVEYNYDDLGRGFFVNEEYSAGKRLLHLRDNVLSISTLKHNPPPPVPLWLKLASVLPILILLIYYLERIRFRKGLILFKAAIINRKGRVAWRTPGWGEKLGDDIPQNIIASISRVRSLKRSIKEFWNKDQDGKQQRFEIHAIPFFNFFLHKQVFLVARDITYENIMMDNAITTEVAQRGIHNVKGQVQPYLRRLRALQQELEKARSEMNKPANLSGLVTGLESIEESIIRLLKVIGDEPPLLSEVSIRPFLESYLTTVQQDFPEGITIIQKIDEDVVLRADQDILRDTLDNLISNAVKAIADQGEIVIRGYTHNRVTALQNKMERVYRIEIEDNGKGIPADMLEYIFDPFFTRSEGGTGLGLLIVQRNMKRHQGNIYVNSEPGNGTTVTLEFKIYEIRK